MTEKQEVNQEEMNQIASQAASFEGQDATVEVDGKEYHLQAPAGFQLTDHQLQVVTERHKELVRGSK